MENLAQNPTIESKIKLASRAAIVALHKLVFETEGDRGNKRRLREYTGFTFREESAEYRNKIEYAGGLSMGDLTSICNILGLDYSGTKEQLLVRIVNSLMEYGKDDDEDEEGPEDEDNENNDDANIDGAIGHENSDHEEDDDSDTNSNRSRAQRTTVGNIIRNVSAVTVRDDNMLKFALGYKDVEDMIRPFDGTDAHPIERWISDFEEAAAMFEWNDLQKIVFAKKSLKGLAKLFVPSEGVIKTWRKLKTALIEEFSRKVSSAELHKQLERRKIRVDETVQEYFLSMKDLAAKGNIEPEALFDYVIDGLRDDASNKAVLYGAKNYREFKERLRIYEKFFFENNSIIHVNY